MEQKQDLNLASILGWLQSFIPYAINLIVVHMNNVNSCVIYSNKFIVGSNDKVICSALSISAMS